jgi:heme exporter protein CcmD
MGGYAAFVWPSYGIAALVLWLNWYLPRKQLEMELRQLKRRQKVKQK